jgi:hypothetical protein
VPGQPVAITRISYENFYIRTADDRVYRCTHAVDMAEDCWSSDLTPIIPLDHEYLAQLEDGSPVPIPEGRLLPCDFSQSYFATASFWIGAIKDCATSDEEMYGEDLFVITVLVIDAESTVWVFHDDSVSSWVDPVNYQLPGPYVRLLVPQLSGILLGGFLAGVVWLAGRYVGKKLHPGRT